MRKLILALVMVLVLAIPCFADDAKILEWPGLNIQGDAVYVFDGKQLAVGAGMDLAKIYDFVKLRAEAVAGVTGDETTGLIGPAIGIDIPALVEKFGGTWLLKGFTSSVGVTCLYDVGHNEFKTGLYVSLIKVEF